jgi:hypothetical protein
VDGVRDDSHHALSIRPLGSALRTPSREHRAPTRLADGFELESALLQPTGLKIHPDKPGPPHPQKAWNLGGTSPRRMHPEIEPAHSTPKRRSVKQPHGSEKELVESELPWASQKKSQGSSHQPFLPISPNNKVSGSSCPPR